ncbi:DEAD/DEAH box helicase [Trichoderma harzianum]|uniref:DEAD/DEAH box helicase n=1 Tax=Trichoderma harzianum TaxID=5544 RepID=A0A0F9ZCS5_TRIHA|nr:DEAD/DEAH box helicase [Trichoderma harzianum]
MAPQTSEQMLRLWYAKLWAPTVDLIGDIAGKEPFIIHGESLIRHCLEESPADFQDGFQLLHAVYFVERFLSNLQKRGCDFDIVFFRDLRDVCVPHLSGFEYKYQYARTVIIKHLQRHTMECANKTGARSSVLEFSSFSSKEFHDYLKGLPIHFVLCHDGAESEDVKDTTILRYFIRRLISMGKNVAIINSLKWKSSKAYAPLLSKSPVRLPRLPISPEFDSPFTSLYGQNYECLRSMLVEPQDLTIRERLGITACLSLVGAPKDSLTDHDGLQERVQAFLLHLAVLKHCTLLERQHWVGPQHCHPHPEDREFLRHIIELSLMLLEKDDCITSMDISESDWDLYDAIDGSLFHFMLESIRSSQWLPNQIIQSWQHLWSAFRAGTDADFAEHLPQLTITSAKNLQGESNSLQVSALPFSHPVLDTFLKDIKLKESQEVQDESSHSVFEDLHHWHNTKLLIPQRKIQKLGFFARKKKQERLASVVAYSASLTNARGKLINPEIVVVKKTVAVHSFKNKGPQKENGSLQSQSKSKKPGRQGNKPGGRESALRAAQEVQEQKALTKRDNAITLWAATCQEIEKDHSVVSRYLKTIKFLNERSKADNTALGSEIHLYLCHLLGQLWAKAQADIKVTPSAGFYLIALMWKWLQELPTIGVSKAVGKAVEKLTSCLKIPNLVVNVGDQTQKMSFKFDYGSFKSMKNSMLNFRQMQLEFAAPYMDRRFDSQQDNRVPFNPDAWQIKVLDSIDANNSLLVIAPTSAGKTFISFYAMKKVLEESDDGVLVYVAPTKALVNQIAAEIGARFTKTYHKQEGKSVWAIYTRDYRVQNPTGCQILVTVPHMLQILLLAPTNAKGPNAWSRRIKRIIFDEVHCIGQDEDGVVWEQLLLSAPCPIIALSATIGNPEPFREWLSQVQKSKGLKLDTVVHTARYSDLRKFIYMPQEYEPFHGLRRNKTLPVPGLDEGDKPCPDFQFIHPVVALTDRARTALEDLSLEARDCLRLWESMKKILSEEELVKFGVPDPSTILPETISKSDVLRWEAELKRSLLRIIESQGSVFRKIRQLLELRSSQEIPPSEFIRDLESIFHLVVGLHRQGALPALVFHYDTQGCEKAAKLICAMLLESEKEWKENSAEWAQKIKDYEDWKRSESSQQSRRVVQRNRGDGGDSRMSKQEQLREEANVETSHWASFNPNAPLERFSFADTTKMQALEANGMIRPLRGVVDNLLLAALQRGVGVHHSGLNREYRQVVEVMFRKGYLRVVVATGTLALGINMPCKTVIFHEDSVFLTAQNFRQASGRAGRRGFDLLGNIVFNQIPRERVYEIMSARLPGLNGQFPISTTLVLRLFSLLYGSDNCQFAVTMVQSLLSQTRLYLGGPESEMSIKHHVRFSIEYLRRQNLLSATGVPINFASIIGHLYFMENAVFAFHSLLRGGYFHQLCSDIYKNPERVLLEMMLVLSHLFVRIPVKENEKLVEIAKTSSSVIFLPPLPQAAERLLIRHNKETLSIFKRYVRSYVSHNLTNKRDRSLPFTQTVVGQETPIHWTTADSNAAGMVRSPFVALSGETDDFKTIHELCQTARGDVFLEESAIPTIPIWPHDTSVRFNAHLYDYYKHGSMHVLGRDNGIRRGDVWFHLKEFSRTLSTIISSLTILMDAKDLDAEEEFESFENEAENTASGSEDDSTEEAASSATSLDGWDDSEDAPIGGQKKGKGLHRVLYAFTRLRYEFDGKFHREWA